MMKAPPLANLMLKARLAERGMYLKDLAAVCGCSTGHIYNVVNGFRGSRRVVRKIEEFIGLPLFTDPQKLVPAAVGESGMTISVPAIMAVPWAKNFETLQVAAKRGPKK